MEGTSESDDDNKSSESGSRRIVQQQHLGPRGVEESVEDVALTTDADESESAGTGLTNKQSNKTTVLDRPAPLSLERNSQIHHAVPGAFRMMGSASDDEEREDLYESAAGFTDVSSLTHTQAESTLAPTVVDSLVEATLVADDPPETRLEVVEAKPVPEGSIWCRWKGLLVLLTCTMLIVGGAVGAAVALSPDGDGQSTDRSVDSTLASEGASNETSDGVSVPLSSSIPSMAPTQGMTTDLTTAVSEAPTPSPVAPMTPLTPDPLATETGSPTNPLTAAPILPTPTFARPTLPPTRRPSLRPTSSPTLAPFTRDQFIANLPQYTTTELTAVGSPQARALDWIDADISTKKYSPTQLTTRFALASFFFGSSGSSWIDNTLWLDNESECNWYTTSDVTSCTDDDFDALILDSNNLDGTIVDEICLLQRLAFLILDNNLLSGEIPSVMGGQECPLSHLTFISVLNNFLSGNIPQNLRNLRKLELLDLADNQLSGEIPSNLFALWSNMDTLDLGNNLLSGKLPSEISALRQLTYLDMYSNDLSGPIPTQLGLLGKLSVVYMEGNLLSGEIPSELGQLTSLQVLHLYDNLLSGTVPVQLCNLVNQGLEIIIDCDFVSCDCYCTCV